MNSFDIQRELSRCGVTPQDALLLGVSGGMDSVFLLETLRTAGANITAAVFDHGLRAESADEAEFVRSFCADRGVPCRMGRGDVRGMMEGEGLSMETAARKSRYQFLFAEAERVGAVAVVTAHHADDQAETVLMRLIRGSGIDGLCGMRPRTLLPEFHPVIPIIRPLLGITRAEIEARFREMGLPHAEDSSNADLTFKRNRIRHELLPLLSEYNPRIRQALCRLAETASLDRDLLRDCAENALTSLRLPSDGNQIRMDGLAYANQPQGLRLRLLRLALADLDIHGERFGADALFQADDFFLHGAGTLPWLDGLLLTRADGILQIVPAHRPDLRARYPLMGEDNWTIVHEGTVTDPDEIAQWLRLAKGDPAVAVLDGAAVRGSLTLRCGEVGERWTPFGMKGRKKLSDYWVDAKIPQAVRSRHALLCDDEGVLWIPGSRVAARAALREGCVQARVFRLQFTS